MLRNGQLLAESSPNELLERFQTDSLEEAFLALSQQQTEDLQGNNMIPDTSGEINPIYNSYNVDNKQKVIQCLKLIQGHINHIYKSKNTSPSKLYIVFRCCDELFGQKKFNYIHKS